MISPPEPVKRGRGRPPLAAQSVAEAVAALRAGNVPPRPRNDIERQVFGKRKGRLVQDDSLTRRAANLALYLLSGLPQAETDAVRDDQISQAVKDACIAQGLPLKGHRSNVRRYVKKMDSPTVTVKYKGPASFGSALRHPQKLPFVVPVDDWPSE